MRIAFLSDLHLAPGSLSRCTTSPERLLRDLDALEGWADEVILLGDVYDLSRPSTPRGWRAHLARVRAQSPELCARLDALTHVWGNHDKPMSTLGALECWSYKSDACAVRALHGHQSDALIKRVPVLAEVGNFAAGWLERGRRPKLARALGRVPEHLERLRGEAAQDGLDRITGFADDVLSEGWDVVVCGHTHRLGAFVRPGGLFLNTGAHTRDAGPDYTLLDTQRAAAQCVRRGLFHDGAHVEGSTWVHVLHQHVWIPQLKET